MHKLHPFIVSNKTFKGIILFSTLGIFLSSNDLKLHKICLIFTQLKRLGFIPTTQINVMFILVEFSVIFHIQKPDKWSQSTLLLLLFFLIRTQELEQFSTEHELWSRIVPLYKTKKEKKATAVLLWRLWWYYSTCRACIRGRQ